MATTKTILNALHKTICDQYAAELERLPMKKSVRETLVDGFKAGMREGINHTCAMLEIEVRDE